MKLRFRAGRFEEPLANALLLIQGVLTVMAVLIVFGFLYFTVGAYANDDPITRFFGALPVLLVMGVVIFVIDRLWQFE